MELPHSTVEFARSADGWVSARSPQAQAMWAKSGDETGSLSLPQHLIDSACAAAAVFDIWLSEATKRWLSDQLSVSENDVRRLYLWLAGTHDIGKAILSFQLQILGQERSHLVYALSDAGLPLEMNSAERGMDKFPHGVASGILLGNWLAAHGYEERFRAVADAHHGIASSGEDKSGSSALRRYKPEWKRVHAELLDSMAELTEVHNVLGVVRRPKVAALHVLTGLVVMADWIASNQDAFPMVISGSQEQRVREGMSATDLTKPWNPKGLERSGGDVAELFASSFGFQPRPVQEAMAREAGAMDRPGLIILEAETGVGKTEAALAAAEMLGGYSQGIYFAAPTMATANGLLDRVLEWAKRSATGSDISSMYLAHSKNQLSDRFRALRFYGVGTDDVEHAQSRHDANAGRVIASSWMSGRRRGLLSNIVVGTVDQVLMMALKQRYLMLRHVALAGKVVIFDEVHAFDTYTSDYLMRAIRWLSYYGAHVVVMSATLPPERRRALVRAYTEADIPDDAQESYPLITIADSTSVRAIPVEASPTNLTATVSVIGDGEEELRELVGSLLNDGGCALIICNTIARAQETYQLFESVYPGEVELHHAGFIAWQRSQREDVLRDALGPTSHRGSGRPERRVIVATQVAEQSLDIDADVLITDVAPIDLLIQRIGRLHRHQRPDSDRPEMLRAPQVIVRGIVSLDPVPEFDSGAEAIYGRRILLASVAHLPRIFRRPDDIPKLVATVYSADPGVPDEWSEEWKEASEESDKATARAHLRAQTYMTPVPEATKHYHLLFDVPDHTLFSLDREEMGNAQVRDAEPTVEVIPIVEFDDGYVPWGVDQSLLSPESPLDYRTARHLASSTVRLPARITRFERDFEAVISTLERRTPLSWMDSHLLKGQLALPLTRDGVVELGRFSIRYSNELGIEIIDEERG